MRIEMADGVGWKRFLLSGVLVGLLLVVVVGAALPLQETERNQQQTEHNVEPARQVERSHADGITGEGVRVGVVDPTGFESDHPSVSEQVVATRSFGTGSRLGPARRDDHGTATAAVISQTAPDAELYLASVGGEEEFVAAIAWLVRQDVDVIVTPTTFYGKPRNGRSDVDRAVDGATEAGIVVVAPAGNLGQGTWQGQFLPVAAGTDTMTDSQFENAQRFGTDGRNQIRGESERLALWVSWEATNGTFRAQLYRETATDPELITTSEPYADGNANQRLVADVEPNESYFVVVRGPPDATGTHLRITTPTHAIETGDVSGSLATPGTARSALTVGAYDNRTGLVEPYSGAGPTADDRTGIDVVAPSRISATGGAFEGTSAATAYVGGIVALLLDADPALTPAESRDLVRGTARPLEPPSPATRSGTGRVSPEAAVERARNQSSTGSARQQITT
jgi:subtilisin family serine protease